MSAPATIERPRVTKRQFGARLRELREAAGLSQAEVAARLGKPQSSWSSWELGTTAPSIEKLDDVAMVLGCSVADLFIPAAKVHQPKKGRPSFDDETPSDE
mgnify:CR=1 FL=1